MEVPDCLKLYFKFDIDFSNSYLQIFKWMLCVRNVGWRIKLALHGDKRESIRINGLSYRFWFHKRKHILNGDEIEIFNNPYGMFSEHPSGCPAIEKLTMTFRCDRMNINQS